MEGGVAAETACEGIEVLLYGYTVGTRGRRARRRQTAQKTETKCPPDCVEAFSDIFRRLAVIPNTNTRSSCSHTSRKTWKMIDTFPTTGKFGKIETFPASYPGDFGGNLQFFLIFHDRKLGQSFSRFSRTHGNNVK